MYGKFFASAFTGSMFGAGADVFAVWGYVIANAVEGSVELNPPLLAAIIGTTPERIASAIDRLCEADLKSRNQTEQGRRLVPDGAFQYRVVNHAHYRAIRNEDDRRAYNREAKRRERAVKRNVIDSQRKSIVSAHTEAEAETETEKDQDHSPSASIRADAPTPKPQERAEKGRQSDAPYQIASVPQLVKLAHAIRDDAPTIDTAEWRERLKEQAAKLKLVYDATSVTSALNQAQHQRVRP